MRASRLEQNGSAGERTLLAGGFRDTNGEETRRVASRAKLSGEESGRTRRSPSECTVLDLVPSSLAGLRGPLISTCPKLGEARDDSPTALKDGILLKYVASAEGIGGRSSTSPMAFQGL